MPSLLVAAAVAFALLAGAGTGAGAATKANPHAELDCSYCHLDTPRLGVDSLDTVNFWRAEGDEPQLCERCHGPESNIHPLGVRPGPEHLGTRIPERLPLGKSEAVRGQVVCVTCHFVHAADADRALLRGLPGSDDPARFESWQDLCRECHGVSLGKRSPHAGDERSCAFCHPTRPVPGRKTTVTEPGLRLCEFCHGPKSGGHYAGASPYTEPQHCTKCHDPHLGNDRPARLRAGYFEPIRDAVTLNPHRRRTLCFACHADGSSGPLRGPDAVALCQRCHGSGEIPGMSHPMRAVPAGYAIPPGWPLSGGSLSCLTCHFPGHVPGALSGPLEEPADAPYLLRGGDAGKRTAVCLSCHPEDQWAGRNPHREAAREKKGCTQCHTSAPVWGRDNAATVRFVADVNILCLACHDNVDHPSGIRHTVTLTAAMRAVPDRLPLGSGRRITCATCHNPHLDSPSGHRLRGAEEPSAFCLRCHKL